MAAGFVFSVVVYVTQKALAFALKRASFNSLKQLFELQVLHDAIRAATMAVIRS